MFALVKDGQVVKFPYSIKNLRADNPSISYPKYPSLEDLASVGIFPVVSVGQNYNQATQVATKDGAVFNEEANRWEVSWSIRDKSESELLEYEQASAARVREQRNKLLVDTDWTQLTDAPVNSALWATYRQALRDVTAQEGFPLTVAWPAQP